MPIAAHNDRVTAYCKICKEMAGHSIVETKGKMRPTPMGVCCTVCEDTHPYRANRPAPRKKSVAGVPLDASYDSLMAGRDLSQTTKYAMAGEFDVRELIAHKTFGVGLVTRVLADRKIEVRFEMGTKVLVHHRSAPA
jgi:hypothetical protein